MPLRAPLGDHRGGVAEHEREVGVDLRDVGHHVVRPSAAQRDDGAEGARPGARPGARSERRARGAEHDPGTARVGHTVVLRHPGVADVVSRGSPLVVAAPTSSGEDGEADQVSGADVTDVVDPPAQASRFCLLTVERLVRCAAPVLDSLREVPIRCTSATSGGTSLGSPCVRGPSCT